MANTFIVFNKKSSKKNGKTKLTPIMEMIVFEIVSLKTGTWSVTARSHLQSLVVIDMHKNYIKQPNYEFGHKS